MSRFAARLAGEIHDSAEKLTRTWVEHLAERTGEERRDVLPTRRLLNDIPMVLRHVASYVEDPEADLAAEEVVADVQATTSSAAKSASGSST